MTCRRCGRAALTGYCSRYCDEVDHAAARDDVGEVLLSQPQLAAGLVRVYAARRPPPLWWGVLHEDGSVTWWMEER